MILRILTHAEEPHVVHETSQCINTVKLTHMATTENVPKNAIVALLQGVLWHVAIFHWIAAHVIRLD